MAKAPKTTTAPTGQIAPFGLRMLPDLKEKIEQAARESGRSMNAEIVARLEQTFSQKTPDELLSALAIRLAQAELDLKVMEVESESRLMDTYLASSAALDAVKFNEHNGYECPLEDEDLKEVHSLFKDAADFLEDRNKEDFQRALQDMEKANDRLQALKEKATPSAKRLIRRTRPKKSTDH